MSEVRELSPPPFTAVIASVIAPDGDQIVYCGHAVKAIST